MEYQARVAAVRLSSDNTGCITGAFSPGVVFSPLTPEPLRSSSSPGSSQEERAVEKKPWSDQQYAAMILCLFVLLAIISAFLCQQLISYMAGPENSASSFSSSSSSSHSGSGGYSWNYHLGSFLQYIFSFVLFFFLLLLSFGGDMTLKSPLWLFWFNQS